MKVKSLLKVACGIEQIEVEEIEWDDEHDCGESSIVWKGSIDDFPLKYAERDLVRFRILKTLESPSIILFGRYKILVTV